MLKTMFPVILAILFAATTACVGTIGTGIDGTDDNGGGTDTTAPIVVANAPANSATGVALNSNVTATFDEDMMSSTLVGAALTLDDGANVAGSLLYNAGSKTLEFDPTADLIASTLYTARVATTVADEAGNTLEAPFTWTFTTGTSADTTPPQVVSVVPADSAADISVTSDIAVTFDEPISAGSVDATSFAVSPTVSGSFAIVGNTVTFTADAPLAFNTTYAVTLSTAITDLAGNAMAAAFNSTFGTAVGVGEDAVLTWVAPTQRDDNSALPANEIAGYRVYIGTTTGGYFTSEDAGNALTHTVSGLPAGVEHFFAVTTYDTQTNESVHSTEVSKIP